MSAPRRSTERVEKNNIFIVSANQTSNVIEKM